MNDWKRLKGETKVKKDMLKPGVEKKSLEKNLKETTEEISGIYIYQNIRTEKKRKKIKRPKF